MPYVKVLMKFALRMMEGGAVRLEGNTQQPYCAVVAWPGRQAGRQCITASHVQPVRKRPSVNSTAQELGQKLNA
jgi:hypothetical protein